MSDFCGYVTSVVPTMQDCADAGCRLCHAELDESDRGEGAMSDMQAKIQYLAEQLKEQQQARLRVLYSDWQADREDVKIRPGAKYTKVDVGFDSAEPGGLGQWQGKLMVEHETGNVYGIKAYGKVHKGHLYGTLETVDDWDWGDYYPKPKGDS